MGTPPNLSLTVWTGSVVSDTCTPFGWVSLALLSGPFIFTSTGVTEWRSFSRLIRIRSRSTISWLVLLVMSMSTRLDFPFFTVSKVSETSKPLGHGLVTSSSNSTGAGLPTGLIFALQVTP